MIVVLETGAGFEARRVGWIDRLRSRVRAARLDRELARGVSPDSSVPLALRSRRLARPSEAARLARCLARIMAAAEKTRAEGISVPIDRAAIRAARPDLEILVKGLATGAVDVRGIAKVRGLLADGAGPLYRRCEGSDLRRGVAEASRALQLARHGARLPPPRRQ